MRVEGERSRQCGSGGQRGRDGAGVEIMHGKGESGGISGTEKM
jgi:hypothetical protein